CLLLRFSKVSRRKGGTHSRSYRSNGYELDPIQKNGRPKGRHRRQASSHIWNEVNLLDLYRLSGRHRKQASAQA
ncbi:hypothetical protein, partial [Pseudomonas sp.]|uniref:hypothetical protein n=1 Tax=Pseudomonas sp. TaxID=306 RepID=UPI003FD88063